MAADVFLFVSEPVVYVGYSAEPELLREGKFAEGTVTYSIKGNAGTIDENGTITGVAPGQLTLTAELTQDGKVVKRVQTRVTVCRKVTNVTLNTNGLQVYEPDDEKIAFLLDPDADMTEMKKTAAENTGADFVSLAALQGDASLRAGLGAVVYDEEGNSHSIEHPDVAEHPGDEGMRRIAEAVLEALADE